MAERDYQIQLTELLKRVGVDSNAFDDVVIHRLMTDSRKVSTGDLFIAYPGGVSDGRDYLSEAQALGAAAILYEANDFELPQEITIPAFAVSDLQKQIGYLAHHFYQMPSRDLQVFGVTGTNGKTTCTYLLTQAFDALELKTAFIGTIGRGKLDQLDVSHHTTPGPVTVHRLLAEYRDLGITQVCMEVSSHALDQGRVNGVEFFCTLFTNLSHDHMDYHGDMTSYAGAKRRLFTQFHSELLITNTDDPFGEQLLNVADADFIVSYGNYGDVRADEITLNNDGLEFFIEANGVEFDIHTPLIGEVNVPNVLLVVATLLSLSTDVSDIQRVLATLKPAPGRMELYNQQNRPSVVVDYAHTPDALEKALLSVREHCSNDLWCVFGCGGDRDKSKRPLMGAAAERVADHLVITNDNPRSESGQAIAEDIMQGINGALVVVLDRATAIRDTIHKADPNDWIVVAGKGHETTQEMQSRRYAFSDRQHVMAALGDVKGELI